VGGFGTLGSYSFCQDKIISTGGEGGMIVTDDPRLHDRLWSYKDHGKDRARLAAPDATPGFRWLHGAGPGTNLRMPGPAAAIGRIQLRNLPHWHAQRHANAMRLARGLAETPLLHVPLPPADLTHAWYRFYAFVRSDRLAPGWSRDRILAEMAARNLPVFFGSCSEIYREDNFAAGRCRPAHPLPVAQELGETSLAFLVDPTWDAPSLDAIVTGLLEVLANANA
jgi:dTDP-4-amino-4,6-dideoxygalactose transaminase